MSLNIKNKLLFKYRSRLRESAIERAKRRLALDDIQPSDLSSDEMEVIVAEEESKIKGKLKDLSLGALITALTLGYF